MHLVGGGKRRCTWVVAVHGGALGCALAVKGGCCACGKGRPCDTG